MRRPRVDVYYCINLKKHFLHFQTVLLRFSLPATDGELGDITPAMFWFCWFRIAAALNFCSCPAGVAIFPDGEV